MHAKSIMQSDYLRKDSLKFCEQLHADQSSIVSTYLTHSGTLEINKYYVHVHWLWGTRVVYKCFRMFAQCAQLEGCVRTLNPPAKGGKRV